MLECLNLNDPKISYLVSKIGYNTLSDIISYNGIEILDIIEQHQEFSDLKNELVKSYEYQLKNKKFNNSIDDMTEISFWRMFTPSFYNWFGDWMIQYKLQNGLSLSEKEQEVLSSNYQGSYDKLKSDISKVVTEDGLPKLAYHGTKKEFIKFNKYSTKIDEYKKEVKGPDREISYRDIPKYKAIIKQLKTNNSIFFSKNMDYATEWTMDGTLVISFLNIKNPNTNLEYVDSYTVIKDNKYDGLITKENNPVDKNYGDVDIYVVHKPNQIKSAMLPSEDLGTLLVENLVKKLKVTPKQARQLIPSKFLNPSDSKVIYFQKLNDNTYGFVTPNGEVFVDKSTQSLNTLFHEFYHIYDKIILSNYNFDPKAKSIIDRLNELVIQAGYLDKVKKMTAYKDKTEIEQLAEARAMLIGDKAEDKILNAEKNWIAKLKSVLKDLVDYILDLIGTKSFKDYSPEEILNMTMNEFTNVMTHDMLYDRSFNKNITNLQNNEISVERKKQIEELFESNPELAESVYETLGFTTLSENEVFIKEIRDNRWLITANNKTWKNIAQGRVENMSSLSDDSSEINRLIKSIKENGYDITQENKAGSVILGARYKNNFLDLKDGKHRAVALGILFPNNLRTIQFTGSRVIGNKDYKINELEDSLEVFKGINIKLQQVTVKQITPQQKQQAQQLYSNYLNTIFPDSKVAEMDNFLYISVLEDLKSNKIIEKQCS